MKVTARMCVPLALLVVCFSMPVQAAISQPAQTGQNACYDSSGTLIACVGSGQDGATRTGEAWPRKRFVDNNDGTVTDALTGLVWTKDANAPGPELCVPGVARHWQAALDYVKCLNDSSYLGRNDWRLPNVNEMASLAITGQRRPADLLAMYGIHNVGLNGYITSTTSGENPTAAVTVDILDGRITTAPKSPRYYGSTMWAWPVRGNSTHVPKTGQSKCYDTLGTIIGCGGTGQDGEVKAGSGWPALRFTYGLSTMADNLTGLVWTREVTPTGPAACGINSNLSWQGALDYVKCLNSNAFLGYSDWRLPNFREMQTLFGYEQKNSDWLKNAGFYNIKTNSSYWTSTNDATSSTPTAAFAANLDAGGLGAGDKNAFYNVFAIPVRGGSINQPVGGSVSYLPTEMDFGHVDQGNCSAPKEFALKNNAVDIPLDVNMYSYFRNGVVASSDFSVSSGGSEPCPSPYPTLAPGASCTYLATYCPTSAGYIQVYGLFNTSDPLQQMSGILFNGSSGTQYTVSTTANGTGGTIVCDSPVLEGATAYCTVTKPVGITLVSLTDNGSDVAGKLSTYNDPTLWYYTIDNISGNHAVVATFAKSFPNLTLKVVGTGSGTVVSIPEGIASNVGCSYPFPLNASVTLKATPHEYSVFAGWTEQCTGTANCQLTMTSDRNVTATFDKDTERVVRIQRQLPTYYQSIATAYADAVMDEVVELWGTEFTGDLVFALGKTVRVRGGYRGDYSSNPGMTIVRGKYLVRNGKVGVEKVAIR